MRYALAALLVAASLIAYKVGLREKKPWGFPVLVVCILGLAVLLPRLMVFPLFAGVLASYVAGVRKEKSWGVRALTVFVGALLLASLLSVAGPDIASGPDPRSRKLYGYLCTDTGKLIILPGPPESGPLKNPDSKKKCCWPAYECHNPKCPRRREGAEGAPVLFADQNPQTEALRASGAAPPLTCPYCGEPDPGNPDVQVPPPTRYVVEPAAEPQVK